MLTLVSTKLRPVLYAAGLLLMTSILAGCAQQRAPGYYNTEHDSTLSDAQSQAQGRTMALAPSQVQLGFGDTAKANKATNTERQDRESTERAEGMNVRALAEAKTYLGTVPCLSNEQACSATRVTLTLAPSGEWRARTLYLDKPASGPGSVIAQQGCWNVIGTSPLRILLQLSNKNPKANLSFITDNVLRINRINDIAPNLEYHLTRQADVDAIPELNNNAKLQCGKQALAPQS